MTPNNVMHPQTGQDKNASLDSSVSPNDGSGKPQGEYSLAHGCTVVKL